MGSVPCVVSWRGIVQFMQQYGRDIRLYDIESIVSDSDVFYKCLSM